MLELACCPDPATTEGAHPQACWWLRWHAQAGKGRASGAAPAALATETDHRNTDGHKGDHTPPPYGWPAQRRAGAGCSSRPSAENRGEPMPTSISAHMDRKTPGSLDTLAVHPRVRERATPACVCIVCERHARRCCCRMAGGRPSGGRPPLSRRSRLTACKPSAVHCARPCRPPTSMSCACPPTTLTTTTATTTCTNSPPSAPSARRRTGAERRGSTPAVGGGGCRGGGGEAGAGAKGAGWRERVQGREATSSRGCRGGVRACARGGRAPSLEAPG